MTRLLHHAEALAALEVLGELPRWTRVVRGLTARHADVRTVKRHAPASDITVQTRERAVGVSRAGRAPARRSAAVSRECGIGRGDIGRSVHRRVHMPNRPISMTANDRDRQCESTHGMHGNTLTTYRHIWSYMVTPG